MQLKKKKSLHSVHGGEQILVASHADILAAEWHLLLSAQRLNPIKKKNKSRYF